jgi:hypothetical protein
VNELSVADLTFADGFRRVETTCLIANAGAHLWAQIRWTRDA